MAGIGPTDLNALCEELLAASVESLDTIPTFDNTLDGSPPRAFVSPGQPALECCDDGQLTVYAGSVNALPTGEPRLDKTGRKNIVGLVVTIVRCIPSAGDDQMNPPTGAELALAAAQTNADAWALWNHLFNMWVSGDLFTFCGEVYWDGLRSITSSGNCGGWNLFIRVDLDGYEEVSSS